MMVRAQPIAQFIIFPQNQTMKHHYLSGIVRILSVLFVAGAANAQSYTVAPIPHQVYVASLPVQATSDDSYSAIIPLPFSVNFFGTNYNEVCVGTNGLIKFAPLTPGGLSPWDINQPIPNASFHSKNAILGVFHDIDNSNAGGTITQAFVGTAPYRKFVVVFGNQSHFYPACHSTKSTFQMIVHEYNSIIDVQIVEKGMCPLWNNGNAVIGLLNSTGLEAYVPPGRNTGQWTAAEEGWRFTPTNVSQNYQYIKCDDAGFDLAVAQNGLWPQNPSSVQFYETMTDAQTQMNPISLSYVPMMMPQTIYAPVGGAIKQVVLSSVDCELDYDDDTALNGDEDTNGDGNLANDDTDMDGIPNFIDTDDDGDLILTNVEYVFADRNNQPALLDTDNDGTPNYLDTDDDGDGVLTINEDYNGNNNPGDDDINANGIPDYLDNAALHTLENTLRTALSVYPNPATDILWVDNQSGLAATGIEIYNINGRLLQKLTPRQTLESLDVRALAAGIYFVRVEIGGQTLHYKFIKN